jgi:uncharacterized membrane protein YeaQ/YmgE (transglycosylase-associated protein family)
MNIIIWLFLGVLIGVLTKFVIFHFQNVSWLSMILLSILGALLGGGCMILRKLQISQW